MMALFELLKKNRSPIQKLEDAVRSNDLSALDDLITAGIDVNIPIQKQGGNTALHLAAILGNFLVIHKLVAAGGRANTNNVCGLSPLYLAVRSNHPAAAVAILSACSDIQGLTDLWSKNKWSELLWNVRSDELLRALLCSIPNLSKARLNLQSNVFDNCVKEKLFKSLRVLLLCKLSFSVVYNPKLEALISSYGIEDTSVDLKEFRDWYSNFCRNPQSLQHNARMTIRRTFHGKFNVYFGIKELPIPESLKKYVSNIL